MKIKLCPNIAIVECTGQGGKSDSLQNAEDKTLPNAAGEGGEEELPAQTCFWNFKEWKLLYIDITRFVKIICPDSLFERDNDGKEAIK